MTTLTCTGVLFDLDGVLVDSTSAVEHHWHQFAERAGIPVDDVLLAAHGARSVDVIAKLVPRSDVEALARWFEDLEIDDVADVAALPGAADLLNNLPPTRWAIVTSCGNNLALARLHAAGLPEPRHLVTGDDVVAGKPDPEGYRLGAASLGATGGDVVVFEDAPLGAEAGHLAGATVVALGTTHRSDEIVAPHHIVDLSDVAIEGTAGRCVHLRVSSRSTRA